MKKKYIYLIVTFLVVASCVAFGRIAGNDFISYDDPEYITENHQIQQGINVQHIIWALTTTYFSYWHPLTWLSHMLDWSLFGANASGHHLVSLLLHIGAFIFLFLFLYKTTNNLWPAAFATAFFALHPLRVESVAWAAERKDVLSMFFGMACIYAYAFYAEKAKISRYFLCLILFILSLMSKPMMVTLPFVLMLLDYWPLGRWQKALEDPGGKFNSVGGLIWEKVPFICLTIISSIVTFWAQNKSGVTTFGKWLPFVIRCANAIVSYVDYLGKIFWPANLAVFYPYELSLALWKVFFFAVILILTTAAVLYYIKRLPFLFTGWFWFLGTLIPVIGLVQVSMQAMADRYTYLPSIGIGIVLAWGIPSLFQREYIRKKALFPTGFAVITILAFLTWWQCSYWKNSFELWNHALKVTKNNFLAHNNIASYFKNKDKIEEAVYNYNQAIRIYPSFAIAHYNRGVLYTENGQYQRAIEDYNKTIDMKPDMADAYFNRGIIYGKLQQYQLALKDFSKTINLKENYAETYNNRGFTYHNMGQYQRAIEDYNKAISLKPDYIEAYMNRGVAYFKQGKNKEGCIDAQKACALGNCKTLESAKAIRLCH